MNYVLNTSLASVDAIVRGPTPEDAIRGGLAEDLLWYDRVVVVTSNFYELKYLIKWMTIDRMVEMVEMGEIGFLRVPAILGYLGATARRRGGFTSGPGLVAVRAQGQPIRKTGASRCVPSCATRCHAVNDGRRASSPH